MPLFIKFSTLIFVQFSNGYVQKSFIMVHYLGHVTSYHATTCISCQDTFFVYMKPTRNILIYIYININFFRNRILPHHWTDMILKYAKVVTYIRPGKEILQIHLIKAILYR